MAFKGPHVAPAKLCGVVQRPFLVKLGVLRVLVGRALGYEKLVMIIFHPLLLNCFGCIPRSRRLNAFVLWPSKPMIEVGKLDINEALHCLANTLAADS